jgi:hypothetical protein
MVRIVERWDREGEGVLSAGREEGWQGGGGAAFGHLGFGRVGNLHQLYKNFITVYTPYTH